MLFFQSEDTEVFKADRNKLFASNEKQTDNHTSMLDMLHWNIPTIVEMPFMKNIFWCCCFSLLIFVAKKVGKGTELQFQGTLQGDRVEDHRLFTRQLHSPQLYIQAIFYTYKTDYMMSEPFTPQHQYAYSPYCSLYIPWCAGKENLFNNQEFLRLIIISFILMTLMLDLGMILAKLKFESLSGLRVLITVHILNAPCICWQQ